MPAAPPHPADEVEAFWRWSAFSAFVVWLLRFALAVAIVTLLFQDRPYFVEGVGFSALLVEAMLGVPQAVRNAQSRSTRGLR